MQDNLQPRLIEDNVKYFLDSALQNSNNFKQKYFNNIYNIVLFIGFFAVLAIILFVNYKGNKSTKEIQMRQIKDKNYIINRLLNIKKETANNKIISNNLITNLPLYNEKI